jgi:hypothetical protein
MAWLANLTLNLWTWNMSTPCKQTDFAAADWLSSEMPGGTSRRRATRNAQLVFRGRVPAAPSPASRPIIIITSTTAAVSSTAHRVSGVCGACQRTLARSVS